MSGSTLAIDIIGFTGFTAAVIVLLTVPARADRRFNAMTKVFTVAAFCVYIYSLGIDLLWVNTEGFFEQAGDFVEVLFPIFVLLTVVSSASQQQVIDLEHAQRAMRASHDMLVSIVEAAPAGILVLDQVGRITFANEAAREVLDLTEDPDTGDLVTPGWTVVDRHGRGRPDFRALVEGRVVGHEPLEVQWPSGWRVRLDVNVEPVGSASAAPGGTVATFERPRRDTDDE